jgi:hypothetical protein
MKNITLFFCLFFLNFLYSQKGERFAINGILVNFPQEVEYKSTLKNSGQFHFVDKDETNILVSVRDSKNMEFYNENFNEIEMLEAFYKWDFDYWKDNSMNAKVSEIEKNLEKKYILWKIELKEGNSIFLFGIKDFKVISISTNNNHLKDEQQIQLLKGIYQNINLYKE